MRLAHSTPVLLIGTGGHAKVVIELFRASDRYNPAALIAQDLSSISLLGVPIVGTDADLPRLRASGLAHAFVAIGDNQRRLTMGNKLEGFGFTIVNAIGPAAIISPSVRLGFGIAVMSGAIVNADAQIDNFAIINTGASVDHDCRIGEGAHLGPGSAIAGNVTIGRLAFMGIGSNAIPGTRVGESAIVGAGACVLHDIPAGATAWGVPARIVRG